MLGFETQQYIHAGHQHELIRNQQNDNLRETWMNKSREVGTAMPPSSQNNGDRPARDFQRTHSLAMVGKK